MNIIMLATTKNDISYDTMSSFPLFLMIQRVLSIYCLWYNEYFPFISYDTMSSFPLFLMIQWVLSLYFLWYNEFFPFLNYMLLHVLYQFHSQRN
jgi:hypothetical protein